MAEPIHAPIVQQPAEASCHRRLRCCSRPPTPDMASLLVGGKEKESNPLAKRQTVDKVYEEAEEPARDGHADERENVHVVARE